MYNRMCDIFILNRNVFQILIIQKIDSFGIQSNYPKFE